MAGAPREETGRPRRDPLDLVALHDGPPPPRPDAAAALAGDARTVAATDLWIRALQYRAALEVNARALHPSLLDFLR